MPELPDLQVFSRNLNKAFAGKKLLHVDVLNTKKLKTTKEAIKSALEGHMLKSIARIGKELHFQFDNKNVLGLHLMLKGQLHYYDGKNDKKYAIIELLFEGDKGLAMTDFQGQATPTLNPDASQAPDALSDKMDYNYLKMTLGKSRATIKNVLLDQHIIRGIGNAYADEILWEARLSPFSVCNKIPADKVKVLTRSIKKILGEAEASIIKSHPDIISGEVRDFLKIHNAKKKDSPTGGSIIHKVVGARKTYYTDEQELFE